MDKKLNEPASCEPKTSLSSIAEFLRNPAAGYAKVQAGERLVLTGRDGLSKVVIGPGNIADYDAE